ncbi:MAG: regulatory protein [Myxococcota bacterium]
MARRTPKPLNQARLFRYADWYLERWASTEKSLSRALWRRSHKVMREHPEDHDVVGQWIVHIVQTVVERRLVNDEQYAKDIIRSHRRRGVSSRKTRSKLVVKGVDANLVDTLMADADPQQELRSASKYARRRRLGPYRRTPTDRDGKQKELAKLGRAGFGFDVARVVVDADSVDALDEMFDGGL